MGETPEELRQEIALQRQAISTDLDAIGDRVSPGRIAERKQAEYRWRASESLRRARYRVMGDPNSQYNTGSADSGLKGKASDAAGSLRESAHGAADAVGGLPDTVRHRTQGSPFAVGLVSFGVGLLIAALLPETEQEQELAARIQPQLESVVAQASESAQGVAADLREPAQQAVDSVKDKATSAAESVKQDAVEHAQAAKDDVKSAASD